MKIKRVEIHGFKSFVDRVSLDFEPGITAILGPNGCGKSNIVDAIRWAMGEQNAKNLRGRFMEDVIFGGSETRKPLGMAEVTMVFSNEDGLAPAAFREYSEIMVTRRLFRNGDSEYLINKTPCRLLDITELFMDTGIGARAYSIIEQGKIGMILNAKPEDRRFLIEEAAGVTKYKARKKTALRKIEATRQNLLRLGDIIGEVRRQAGSLKRQAQKAERFKILREELKGIEVRFARQRFTALRNQMATLTRDEDNQRLSVAGLSAQQDQGELRLEELRLLQAVAEKDVARVQEQVFHLAGEIQKVEGRIGFATRELEGLGRRQEQLAVEHEEVARRLLEVVADEKRLSENRSNLGADLDKELRRLAEGESALEELTLREQNLGACLEESRQALYRLLTELSRIGARYEESSRRRQQLEERKVRNRNEAVKVREQVEEASELAASLQVDLDVFRDSRQLLAEEQERLREAVASLRQRIDETEKLLLQRREELNRSRSRLESLRQLERDLEGFGSGVKALLADNGFRERFPGTVADLFEVSSRFEVALESVLGERLQALPAASRDDVLSAVEFLRGRDGRCTFVLPCSKTSSAGALAGATPLGSLVQARAGHEALVATLLQDCYQVDSFEPFWQALLPAGVVLVTEGGDILTGRGEFTGGGCQGLGQGLLHKKREMKELSVLVERQSGEVATLDELRLRLRDDQREAEERLREVDAGLHRQALKVVDSEKDLARLRENQARLQDRLEVLCFEEEQLHEEGGELDRQMDLDRQRRGTLEEKKVDQEEAVLHLQEELLVLRREVSIVREQVTALKVSVASLREREDGSRSELERLGRLGQELLGRRALIASRREESVDERERLNDEKERLRVELDVLFRRHEEEKVKLETVRARFEAGQGLIDAQELSLKEQRVRLAKMREELAARQLQLRELVLESEHLQATIVERYRVELMAEGGMSDDDFDPLTAEGRQRELQQAIDGIGEVNLTAIDEYRELEERGRFLVTQQEDLRQSLDGLQTAISKINRTTRKRFRETFDLVNEKFREIFPRLFRGGQGELKLTDEEDLLETGIEIVVQPPGKKLQNVTLLSGGEKALTAVALIFSIFLIKPSPFCMLDEVDAPLDDANIGRFNEMVREMAEFSQFIIITHSKRTMEVADTLYGVTMEEPGVSKLVSVRFNEFQGEHGV
ncbi:MAG: chromosome segregation protein SMC [Desulfuromonadaceae bacterium GWC2_58_13]|nr:MAG: chromosome segregation protein SMC [Desulfuromonadaceae bacterium GWC2_58_13]